MKVKVVVSVVMFGLASANSVAVQINVKPGLWEHTMKLDEKSVAAVQKEHQQDIQQGIAEMKKRFAEMPPEQRAQLESILKAQGNSVDLDSLANIPVGKEPVVSKECITQAQIDEGVLSSTKGNCKTQATQVSSGVFKIVSECKENGLPHHDEVLVTVQNPKSYTGKASFASEKVGNTPVQATLSGKWLSSDCGSVKPRPSDELDEEDAVLESEE